MLSVILVRQQRPASLAEMANGAGAFEACTSQIQKKFGSLGALCFLKKSGGEKCERSPILR